MISVNTNDVQQSEITFDHICVASRIMLKVLLMAGACVASRIMPKVLLMAGACVASRIMPNVLLLAGACTYLSTTVLQLHEDCVLVWKEYNHNHLIFALFYHSVAINIEIDLLEVLDLN